MNEKTVKCPICGEPYKVYPFYVGDQSACSKCVNKAEANTMVKRTYEERANANNVQELKMQAQLHRDPDKYILEKVNGY